MAAELLCTETYMEHRSFIKKNVHNTTVRYSIWSKFWKKDQASENKYTIENKSVKFKYIKTWKILIIWYVCELCFSKKNYLLQTTIESCNGFQNVITHLFIIKNHIYFKHSISI